MGDIGALLTLPSGVDRVLQMITVLFAFVFVLVVTWLATRFIARYQQGMNASKNIRVIETFRVSNNKFIQILEIGEVYLAVAVCKDQMSLLAEIKKEQLVWLPEEGGTPPTVQEDFQEILNKLKEKLTRK